MFRSLPCHFFCPFLSIFSLSDTFQISDFLLFPSPQKFLSMFYSSILIEKLMFNVNEDVKCNNKPACKIKKKSPLYWCTNSPLLWYYPLGLVGFFRCSTAMYQNFTSGKRLKKQSMGKSPADPDMSQLFQGFMSPWDFLLFLLTPDKTNHLFLFLKH